jgi:hypothetical protein
MKSFLVISGQTWLSYLETSLDKFDVSMLESILDDGLVLLN